MPQIPAQPLTPSRLRLVGLETDPVAPHKPTRTRVAQVAKENLAASVLSPFDARLIFAQQVATNLEGGRAALLRPERRRALMTQAQRLGLRPFDANLVIAIVQDAAINTHGKANVHDEPAVRASLAMVRKPQPGTHDWTWRSMALSLAIALVLLTALIAAIL